MAAVADQFEARMCASTARIIRFATVVAAPASLGSPESRSSVNSATRFDSSSQFRVFRAVEGGLVVWRGRDELHQFTIAPPRSRCRVEVRRRFGPLLDDGRVLEEVRGAGGQGRYE